MEDIEAIDEEDLFPEVEDDVQGGKGTNEKVKKIQLTLGTWFLDKRMRKKKYISLSGRVYTGSEAVKRSRHEKFTHTHPSQLMRAEFLYAMQSLTLPTLLYHFQTKKESLTSLENWGLPARILQRYSQHKIKKLFPWQIDCLLVDEGIVYEGKKNLIYSAPTSGGKTLVAELLMMKRLSQTMKLGDPKLNPRKTIFFIVPFIALAEEKSSYFRELWSDMNLGIRTFHNDDGSSNQLGEDVELVICTIERANILINQLLDEKREKQLSMLIIDEIHLLSDSNRGFLLEVMLTKLRYLLKDEIQIIGMSATLPNIHELAIWLNASLYITEYRPVNLEFFIAKESSLFQVTKKIDGPQETAPVSSSSVMMGQNPTSSSLHFQVMEPEEKSHSNDSCKSLRNQFLQTSLTAASSSGTQQQQPHSASSFFQQVMKQSSSSSLNNNGQLHQPPSQQLLFSSTSSTAQTISQPVRVAPGMVINPSYSIPLPPPPSTNPIENNQPPLSNLMAETKKEMISYTFISSIPKLQDDLDGFKSLCLDTIQREKSALVFCNSKRRCETCAQVISRTIIESPLASSYQFSSFLPPSHHQQQQSTTSLFQSKYQQIIIARQQLLSELDQTMVGLCPILRECLPYGIAYHHAGLTNDERVLIEKGFRQGIIQILCTTSTLSAGVNLPAHRVIIRSLQMGDQYISLASFRQMCGRAGRTGLDSNGEAILILGSKISKKEKEYCEYLLTGELEPLKSSLHCGQGGGIEKLLLEMISCGRLKEEQHVLEFMRCTLLNTQIPMDQIKKYVKDALFFLKKEQFVLTTRTIPAAIPAPSSTSSSLEAPPPPSAPQAAQLPLLYVSPFGRATSLSGIPPKDAPIILQSLLQAKKQLISLTTGFHLLYLITPITCSILEPDWFHYDQLFHFFMKEFPEMMSSMISYLNISPLQIQSFRFQKPILHSESYFFYKRFYLTMILFLFIQEWPITKMLYIFSNGSGSSSSGSSSNSDLLSGSSSTNNGSNNNANNTSGGITRGQLQQLQKDITIYCSMIILFCEKCNWDNLVILLKTEIQSKLSYYSGGGSLTTSGGGAVGAKSVGNNHAQREFFQLLKIGKEMTFIRAKYLYEKHEVKHVMDVIALGEERLAEILVEMLPFHEKITFLKDDKDKNNNNHHHQQQQHQDQVEQRKRDRVFESSRKLAQQIIYRAKISMREEIRRKEESLC